jgi:hypothetical protein
MAEEQKIMDEPVVPGKSNPAPGDPDQTKTRLHLSHDGFFKVNFHNKYLAESFARENLPAEITKDLDFKSMTRDEWPLDIFSTRRSCPGSKIYFDCSGSYPVRPNSKGI